MSEKFIVPKGTMSMPTSIPQTSGMEVDPVSEGIHPAYLAHIIDYGTQENTFRKDGSKSRQITLVFELPHEKRTFKEEQGPQSSLMWKTTTFVVSEQSNLYKIMKAITGKNLKPEEFSNFNLGELLGKPLCITVEHVERNGKIKDTISGYAKFNENLVPAEQFVPTVQNQFFLINEEAEDMNFTTMNFATLYESVRKKIMQSEEAKRYAANGGQFAQHIDINKNQSAAPTPPSSKSNVPEDLEWLSKEFTYEDMVKQGWTKDDLIGHGYAKKKEVAPAPPKAPKAPTISQAPKAPQAPQIPQVPSVPSTPKASTTSIDDKDLTDDLPF